MNTSFLKSGGGRLGALAVAPLVIYAVMRLLIQAPGPSGVRAATPGEIATEDAALTRPAETAPQAQARAYAASASGRGAGGSPFLVEGGPEEAPVIPTLPVRAAPDTPRATTPRLSVSSILGGVQRLAVVDGRILRIGDEAVTGWTITGIDADRGVVTIEHVREGRIEIALEKPER